MSEADDAIAALERLGLTGYEARTFVALQKLGTGTARDVARVADVPRSQVYTAAEGLAERGLVEVQQSSPIRYRPVGVDEARHILEERFERERDRAFEYVDRVSDERGDEEGSEEVWTLRGSDRIDGRAADLIASAGDRAVFGASQPELTDDPVASALRERAAAGVAVTVVSGDPAVRERFADGPVTVGEPPARYATDETGGRVVHADDALLLSVVDAGGEETAIWSAGTNFATVLGRLVDASLRVE